MTAKALLLAGIVVAGCGADNSANLSGEALAADAGCLACHTESSTELAPTLHGRWGTEVALADGRTVTIDEEYVRRSITDPSADVAVGYQPTMPLVPLDEGEIERLVEWVESLG